MLKMKGRKMIYMKTVSRRKAGSTNVRQNPLQDKSSTRVNMGYCSKI